MLVDHHSMVLIQAELDRLSTRLTSLEDTQSSLIHRLEDITTRLFLIDPSNYIIAKEKLEEILQRMIVFSHTDSHISMILATLERLTAMLEISLSS